MFGSSTLSPAACRILPYAIYLGFLVLEQLTAALGPAHLIGFDLRWLYPAKVFAVAIALSWLWPRYAELHALPRWSSVPPALIAGIVVWVLWINLDHGWATLGDPRGYDPRGSDGHIVAVLAIFRLLGAMFVVPVMEELFWRSFIMRWISKPDFLSLPPASVRFLPFAVTAALFGFQHHQWLAGIVAGVIYGLLYVRCSNLWVPTIAHAITNGALGAWVLASGQWRFW